MRNVVLFLCLLVFYSGTAYAEKRVALVIGNSDYKHVSKLDNPVNDAKLIVKVLKGLGFEVVAGTDVTQKDMKRAVSNFAKKLRAYGEDTIGLVFYAGHGVQVDGYNYLIPVDAEINSESDVAIESVSANDLLYAMNHAGNRINIIVFDACRDNPYRGLFRSGKRGLASMDAPRGSLISFSTAPGKVAADGKANNSPFTKAFAKHIVTPGITIERVLKRVGKDVLKATAEKQRPWWNRDVYDDLYLAGLPQAQKPPVKPLEQNAAGVFVRKVRHGYKFQDCPECPKMITVQGGTFMMGTSENEKGRKKNEGPQRHVTISKFAVGQFEVTFAEWEACVAGGGCKGFKPRDPFNWGGGKRPVMNISWDRAQDYIKWISTRSGYRYRLLSEAEWEYVTRAGTSTPYWWGASISPDQANYELPNVMGHQKTLPVDSYKPNPWGLYNVHGNVYEWVEDCWNESYRGAPKDGSAWFSGDCSKRVFRGGSWGSEASKSRSGARDGREREGYFTNVGFRVARDL